MLRRVLPPHFAIVCALVLLGCSGDPGGLGDGALAITVSGLPSGTSAAVSVTGPDGYSRTVTRSETLSGLSPGAYTIVASQVTARGSGYAPSPRSQTLQVQDSDVAAAASVIYSASVGSLKVIVSGLPAGQDAAITVAGPGGYSRSVTATTTLTDLSPGTYTVAAEEVTSGSARHYPSPASQNRSVSAGATAEATVNYSGSPPGALNLFIARMYLVQSTQTLDGDVPLIAGRDAYLRVFVQANQPNIAAPRVRVRLSQNGIPIGTHTILAPAVSVPTSIDQGTFGSSWNLFLPGAMLQAGLSIVADVDPDNLVVEGSESDNTFPSSGLPLPLDVRPVPTFRVRFVPVRQSANGLQGNVADANKGQFLAAAKAIHPLGSVDAAVRPVYTTNAPPLEPDNRNDGWTTLLNELDALRTTDLDAEGRYYYGVVRTSYTSGVAGVGYVSQPGVDARTALGWDFLTGGSAAVVAAHEWGHNWARMHAPCGGPAPQSIDDEYPGTGAYAGGKIGVYGLHVATETVRSPATYTDIMGYCSQKWTSDYTYLGVMSYRARLALPATMTSSGAVQPTLLVWGRVVDGEPVLEPAFQLDARPHLPTRSGPYLLEGRAQDGTRLFALPFEAKRVADAAEGTAAHFAFTLPLSMVQPARLAALRLSMRGGRAVTATATVAPPAGRVQPSVGRLPDSVEVRRAGAGRLTLHWNAAARPMVLVRDPATGQVLSFARGGEAQVWTEGEEVEVLTSDRVRSSGRRIRAAAR